MKILVLSHEYPPIGGGGGRFVEDLSMGLSERGHELWVLTTHFKDLSENEEHGNLRISRISCGRRVPYRARLVEMARYIVSGLWVGLRLIHQWNPDVIHVHFAVPAGVLAFVLSILTRTPYILTVQLGDVPGGAPAKTERWFRWIFPFTPPIWRSASAVIAVSEYTRQLALKHYPVNIRVIYNGFDYRTYQPRVLHAGDPPKVVWAGRFVPEKNPGQVVHTLLKLPDLDWSCVMIGDGIEKRSIEQQIAQSGLEERFTLPGWLSQEQVMDWFTRSDILFMPSLSEGLPLVGIQGLAAGLAIVASNIGGFADLVEPGSNGYLVDNPHGDGFIEPLRLLLSDPIQLRAFRETSHRMAGKFDIHLITDAYEKLLNEVSAGKE